MPNRPRCDSSGRPLQEVFGFGEMLQDGRSYNFADICFWQKADITIRPLNVRLWVRATIARRGVNVRFWPIADIDYCTAHVRYCR
jgi:hypothetical protein